MRINRLWLWISGGLSLLMGLYFLWPASGSGDGARYQSAVVDRGDIVASVKATGTLTPITTVLVGSQLSGQVTEILADYNSPVEAGQVMARLYSQQIKARRDAAGADLEQGKADLEVKKAQVDRARATRSRAEASLNDLIAQRDRSLAQLADARRNLDRQSELTLKGAGSISALDTARTLGEVQKAALASSDAQIAAAKAELDGLGVDIALAEAQVKSGDAQVLQRQAKLKDAEIDVDRTDIRSPVEGVVVQRQIDLGQTVAASLSTPTLFTVAQDLREIDVLANIDEADVGRLKPGQNATFTVNAYPNRSFKGSMRLVRLGAQTIQNVVTYTAVIGVDNKDLALLPGMTANIQIVTEERRQVLRVPNAALRVRIAGPASAGGQAAPASPRSSPQRGLQELREQIVTQAQPSPEQLAAIDKIIAERGSRPRPAVQGLSEDDRRAAFREERRQLRDQLLGQLDPDRRAKMDASSQPGVAGRIAVLAEDGTARPVPVRLGPTDGAFTEIRDGDLKEGMSIVMGGGPKQSGAASPAGAPRGPRLF